MLHTAIVVCLSFGVAHSFVPLQNHPHQSTWSKTQPPFEQRRRDASGPTVTMLATSPATSQEEELTIQKRKLLGLVGKLVTKDPVLADPITKEPIQISAPGVMIGGESDSQRRNIQYVIRSPTNSYLGTSDSFLNLLEPIPPKSSLDELETTTTAATTTTTLLADAMKQALLFVPPPLRGTLKNFPAFAGSDPVIPMRDLFTSPAVSFAYERGWRQGFASAGFPGPDTEAEMAMDYFAPVVARASPNSVVVDMSCATGLFTRRLAATNKYGRVLGCDYSESMLTEARRRIRADPKLSSSSLKTRLDLVRLDVGQIPMQTESVDCLHAGAAMHCWPDLDAAAKEIYRVLKPGGRYFATTFLALYFSNVQAAEGGGAGSVPNPSTQAFQYFESVDTLRSLMEAGGFAPDKIFIEVLGAACVVIRCEK